jgi:hypothetical protein
MNYQQESYQYAKELQTEDQHNIPQLSKVSKKRSQQGIYSDEKNYSSEMISKPRIGQTIQDILKDLPSRKKTAQQMESINNFNNYVDQSSPVHVKTLRLVQKKQQTCSSFAEGVKYYSTRDPKREEGLNKSQVNGG